MVSSNNKRKLPANNQNLERDPVNKASCVYIRIPRFYRRSENPENDT